MNNVEQIWENPWSNESRSTLKAFRAISESLYSHIENAEKKHPFFCDKLLTTTRYANYDGALEYAKKSLADEIANGDVSAMSVLITKIHGMQAAYANGQIPQAMHEAFDAMAVLARIWNALVYEMLFGRECDWQ